jgi:integrase/recombinase XerD
MWQIARKEFEGYLLLEKAMSKHTIEAYLYDILKLQEFCEAQYWQQPPSELTETDLGKFLLFLCELGIAERTQARIVSGIKAFYKYLLLTDQINDSPASRLALPQLGRELPTVLSVTEVEKILEVVQWERNEMLRLRNRAMLETLYACGLRVSELTELRLSHLSLDIAIIKVTGKGSKERLIPIGDQAIAAIRTYLTDSNGRLSQTPKTGEEDIVFLNRRGHRLTRNMVFLLVQKWTGDAGVRKTVSPHTFRHSFATHLIEGGADLRAIQEMLGHSSITTTEIYTHLDTDFLRQTILLCHPRNRRRK